MNAIALLDLCMALAPLIPSAEAAPQASLEWQRARRQWLASLATIRISEEAMREMASRRIWRDPPAEETIN